MLPFLFAVAVQVPPETPVARPPRLEASIVIDGSLDEPAWREAARLSGFRQYQPVDSRPAEERTEVLVWYSPTAMHFGVVAHARDPRTIRATVADRDDIGRDDRITIYLDTFDDRRRAFFFAVNPLGAQADGVHNEGANSAGRMFGGEADFSPDFQFDSHGTLTDSGYVVEVRIPFKSLRYPASGVQRWGLQIVRDNPATGYEDTWTDVRRAGASFLAQAGVMEGLHDLERGVVTEVQPFVTAASSGERAPGGEWERADPDFDGGANLRLGFTQLAFDATINPDFSQVESDASLVTVNERFALFVTEKRPFFLEGIELFSTPNQLVYTRRIVDPLVGGKITGKFGAWSVAHLTAFDEFLDANALVNIARVRRDLAGSSTAGVTVTSREDGRTFNRVAAADARIVFERLYFVEGQFGGSWTGVDGASTESAPIWKLTVDRTGRHWGFNYEVNGIGNGFNAALGFVPRTGAATARAFNRFSWYGARGALLETVTVFLGPTWLWHHDDFLRDGAIERTQALNLMTRFRGGWSVNGSLDRSYFALDPAAYSGLSVQREGGAIEPYEPPSRLDDLYVPQLSISTPIWQRANASFEISHGGVPIFIEGSEGRETRASLSLALRPSTVIRAEGSAVLSRIERKRDDSEFARVFIPRLKLEYQPTRALFFRLIGEYRSEQVAAPRDARTGEPLLIGGTPTEARERGEVRADWLVSYEPTPGTVAFLGYGSSHLSPVANRWSEFERFSDGLFIKLAYQFRR